MSMDYYRHYGPLFMKHVEKTDTCWIWKGAYGLYNLRFKPLKYGFYSTVLPTKRRVGAHRWSYELHKGPIPKGLQIDHLCKNTLCVNPDHLEAVTQQTNLLRSDCVTTLNRKKTHCPSGHKYDGDNVKIINTNGLISRKCKICIKETNDRNNLKIALKKLIGSKP